MEQLNWQINLLQANQLAKTALKLPARAQTISRKSTRSSQPTKVTYGEGVTALRKQVNLVMGDQLDIYTRNRLKSVLQDNQVSYTTGKAAIAGATNIYL